MSNPRKSHLPIALLLFFSACGSPTVITTAGNQGLSKVDQIQLADAQRCAKLHIERMVGEGVLYDQDLRPDARGRIPVRYTPANFVNETTTRGLNQMNLFSFVSQELTRTGRMVVTDDVDSAELEAKIRIYNELERGDRRLLRDREQSNVILMEFQLWKGSTQIYSYAQDITKRNFSG